jgi:hypothetical protein
MAVSGFHFPLIDNMFLSTLMRIFQTSDSPLYGLAVDIIKALIEVSTYNTM